MCVLKKHVESAVSQWLSFSNLAWSHPAIILWLLVSMRPHQPSCLSPSYTQSHTRTQMLVLLVIFFILLFFVLTLMMIWIDFYWLDLYPVCNVSCKKTLISCMSKLSSSYLRAICFDIGGLSWSEFDFMPSKLLLIVWYLTNVTKFRWLHLFYLENEASLIIDPWLQDGVVKWSINVVENSLCVKVCWSSADPVFNLI